MTVLALLAVALLLANLGVLWRRRVLRIRATWALEDAEASWPAQLQDPPANYAPITRTPMVVSRDMLTTIPADPRAVAYAGIVHAERAAAIRALEQAYGIPPAGDPDGGRRGD